MTRNEARGILIRMQSEIENPYSTEAQALGIAIEKMERDYETEYWESQWKIDEYERPSKKERAADALIRYCKSRTLCNDCPFGNHPFNEFCQLAEVTKEGTPNKWGEDTCIDTCKVENRPTDERNDEERIIYRLEKLEAQMGDFEGSVEYLKDIVEAQAERLAKIRKAFSE